MYYIILQEPVLVMYYQRKRKNKNKTKSSSSSSFLYMMLFILHNLMHFNFIPLNTTKLNPIRLNLILNSTQLTYNIL